MTLTRSEKIRAHQVEVTAAMEAWASAVEAEAKLRAEVAALVEPFAGRQLAAGGEVVRTKQILADLMHATGRL